GTNSSDGFLCRKICFLREGRSGNQIRKRQDLDEELLVLLSMRLGPFSAGLRPRECPTFFALDPFVFADRFLDQTCDPVEGISVHHRRDRGLLRLSVIEILSSATWME